MLQRLVDAAAVEVEIERVRSLSGAAHEPAEVMATYQIETCRPISTTESGGRRKKSLT